jgi:hypothetical protein
MIFNDLSIDYGTSDIGDQPHLTRSPTAVTTSPPDFPVSRRNVLSRKIYTDKRPQFFKLLIAITRVRVRSLVIIFLKI